jgi:hypothetical protein
MAVGDRHLALDPQEIAADLEKVGLECIPALVDRYEAVDDALDLARLDRGTGICQRRAQECFEVGTIRC